MIVQQHSKERRMFTTKSKNQSAAGMISKVVGALALGTSAALVGFKAVGSIRKSMRAKMHAALRPRLSQEDREAIVRMEGEGGPSAPPLPPASVTS
jgi:hypothetical protein